MNWLKEVIVDIAVSVLIVMTVFIQAPWLAWIIWVYTGLMLLAKGLVLLGDGVQQLMKKTRTEAPEWFSHLLYAINIVALLYMNWWYAGFGWMLIWLFSYLAQRRLTSSKNAVSRA